MGKTTVNIDVERCKGCGYCILACQQQVLKSSSSMNSKGYNFPFIENSEKCTGCTFCAIMCPEMAIEVESRDQGRV